MVSSLKQLYTAIIFIFFSISLLPTHARDSMFFSKMQRNETSEVPRETPANEKEEQMSFPPSSQPWGDTPANEKEPMSFPPSSQQGYGLYGHGTTELIIINNNNNNNINNNDAQMCDNNSGGHEASSKYINNEYVNKGYGMSDTRLINNDDDNNNHHNIGDAEKYDNYQVYHSGREASSRYVNNEYVNKGYGKSDNKFSENGKYHYDAQAERYQNGYDPLSENSAGYVSYNGNGKRGGSTYGYGSYRSGSSTNGNAYKEYSERVENQNNAERFGNQYNNERFGDQYSNEGQEDQFHTP